MVEWSPSRSWPFAPRPARRSNAREFASHCRRFICDAQIYLRTSRQPPAIARANTTNSMYSPCGRLRGNHSLRTVAGPVFMPKNKPCFGVRRAGAGWSLALLPGDARQKWPRQPGTRNDTQIHCDHTTPLSAWIDTTAPGRLLLRRSGVRNIGTGLDSKHYNNYYLYL